MDWMWGMVKGVSCKWKSKESQGAILLSGKTDFKIYFLSGSSNSWNEPSKLYNLSVLFSPIGPSKFIHLAWSSHCAAWRVLARASVVLRQGVNHSVLFPPETICSCPFPLWVIWVEFCLQEIYWYPSPVYIEGYYPQSFRLENRNPKKIDEFPKIIQ